MNVILLNQTSPISWCFHRTLHYYQLYIPHPLLFNYSSQCLGLQNPSYSSHCDCSCHITVTPMPSVGFGCFFFFRCTALYRWLSAYHCEPILEAERGRRGRKHREWIENQHGHVIFKMFSVSFLLFFLPLPPKIGSMKVFFYPFYCLNPILTTMCR